MLYLQAYVTTCRISHFFDLTTVYVNCMCIVQMSGIVYTCSILRCTVVCFAAHEHLRRHGHSYSKLLFIMWLSHLQKYSNCFNFDQQLQHKRYCDCKFITYMTCVCCSQQNQHHSIFLHAVTHVMRMLKWIIQYTEVNGHSCEDIIDWLATDCDTILH